MRDDTADINARPAKGMSAVMKEYIGWLVAALILIWHVLSIEIILRLDWVNFGNQYQQSQRAIIEAVQSLSRDVQTFKGQIGVLEQKVQPATPEKKP